MLMLILWIAIIGVIVYLITTYLPMPEPFKIGIYVLSAIFIILLLMNAFGVVDQPVPKLR